jgi:hypothetical protein
MCRHAALPIYIAQQSTYYNIRQHSTVLHNLYTPVHRILSASNIFEALYRAARDFIMKSGSIATTVLHI